MAGIICWVSPINWSGIWKVYLFCPRVLPLKYLFCFCSAAGRQQKWGEHSIKKWGDDSMGRRLQRGDCRSGASTPVPVSHQNDHIQNEPPGSRFNMRDGSIREMGLQWTGEQVGIWRIKMALICINCAVLWKLQKNKWNVPIFLLYCYFRDMDLQLKR